MSTLPNSPFLSSARSSHETVLLEHSSSTTSSASRCKTTQLSDVEIPSHWRPEVEECIRNHLKTQLDVILFALLLIYFLLSIYMYYVL